MLNLTDSFLGHQVLKNADLRFFPLLSLIICRKTAILWKMKLH